MGDTAKKEKKQNLDLLKRLKDKRDLAVRWRESTGWDDRLKRSWNYYHFGTKDDLSDNDGKSKSNKRKANYVFSNIESIIPKMFDRMPSFQVKPGGDEDSSKVSVVESVLRYKIERACLEEKFEDAVRDQLVSSIGYLKPTWGYEAQEGEENDEGKKEDIVEKDDIEIKIVNPKNLFITAGDTRAECADGFFERMIVAISDAKDRFDKEFKADHVVVDSSGDDKENLKKAGERCVIWEFHDAKTKKVYTFNDESVLDTRDWYDHGHFPYVELPNYRAPHEYYPWSEIYQIEPLQDELVEIDKQASDFRKRSINPKKIVTKGSIDELNMQRLRSPKQNVIEVIQQGSIQWENPAMIGRDIYEMRAQRKEDISLMTGQNEISRGGVEETVQTATGQAILNDAAQGRVRHKVRVMERAFKEILYQVHGLLMQFQDKKERIKITDNEENPYRDYTKEDIKGSFDFIIDIVESMPILRDKRGQIALQAYELFKDDPDFDQKALKKRVIKLAFQDINAEDLMVREPPKEQAVVEEEPQQMPSPPGQPMMPVPQEMPAMMPPQQPQLPQGVGL